MRGPPVSMPSAVLEIIVIDRTTPALLGGGDARRRVPLRPGARSWAATGRAGSWRTRPSWRGSRKTPSCGTRRSSPRPGTPPGPTRWARSPAARWAEWNDRYRDDVRRFWRGDANMVGPLATRLAGSSDLYLRDGRKPFHSINFVTSHDGFTLNDLVSYARKHNEENGEGQPRRRDPNSVGQLRRGGTRRTTRHGGASATGR